MLPRRDSRRRRGHVVFAKAMDLYEALDHQPSLESRDAFKLPAMLRANFLRMVAHFRAFR